MDRIGTEVLRGDYIILWSVRVQYPIKYMYHTYLISHNRILLSSDPDKKESSVGFIHNVTTFLL